MNADEWINECSCSSMVWELFCNEWIAFGRINLLLNWAINLNASKCVPMQRRTTFSGPYDLHVLFESEQLPRCQFNSNANIRIRQSDLQVAPCTLYSMFKSTHQKAFMNTRIGIKLQRKVRGKPKSNSYYYLQPSCILKCRSKRTSIETFLFALSSKTYYTFNEHYHF